jgi:hypothetical protein
MPEYDLPMGFGNVVRDVKEQESSEDDSTGGQVDIEAWKMSVRIKGAKSGMHTPSP